MEATKILSSSVADILFEGRNKSYGAYELRKNYEKRMYTALFAGCGFILILFGVIINAQTSKTKEVIPDIFVTSFEIYDPPPPTEKPSVKEASKGGEKSKPTAKGNSVVIVDHDVVPISDNEIVSTSDGVEDGEGNAEADGGGGSGVEGNHSGATGGGEQVVAIPDSSNFIHTSVDEPASFPGGINAWSRYLIRTLDKDKPLDKGAAPGTYTVIVNFVVNTDGSIEQVNAGTDFGFHMEEEAIRAVRKGPKWKPAKKNGQTVRTIYRQPITFIVPE